MLSVLQKFLIYCTQKTFCEMAYYPILPEKWKILQLEHNRPRNRRYVFLSSKFEIIRHVEILQVHYLTLSQIILLV